MKTASRATISSKLARRGFDAAYPTDAHREDAARIRGQGGDVVVRVARGEVLAMAGAETSDIRGVAGRAWVTQEGDAADVIVAAGDAFHPAPRGKIVVQALADDGAVLRVTRRRRDHTAPAPRTPAARRPWG